MFKLPSDTIHPVLVFLSGLVPGALGATVAVALDRTLTWTQRFLAISVGIVVSYYVRAAAADIMHWGPFILQAVSFSSGMVAYKVVPNFVAGSATTAKDIPGDLWAWVKGKLPGGSSVSGD